MILLIIGNVAYHCVNTVIKIEYLIYIIICAHYISNIEIRLTKSKR